MTISSRLVAAFIALTSSAQAAETTIGGQASAGTHVTFELFVGEPPASSAYYTPPGIATQSDLSIVPLRVTLLRRSNGRQATTSVTEQCVLLATGNRSYIACASEPRNEVSGVLYEQRGTTKSGDRQFICKRGCSKSAPRRLEESGVEAGC